MKSALWATALTLAYVGAARAAPVVTNPDWLRKPTADDIGAAYPIKALKAGRSGNTVILCTVNTQGLLRDCKVTKEDPPGFGFGAASLVVSGLFLMKPQTRDGQAVDGAEITIPINWTFQGDPIENEDGHTGSRIPGNDIAGSGGGYDIPTVFVFGQMVWAQTPSVADIEAALAKKVGDRFADGKVVLQCTVAKKTGMLSNCATLNYSPGMQQFQGVARSLTSKFRADPKVLTEVKETARVNVAMSFPDMASPVWGTRYLSHAQWIRQPSFDPNEKLFPPAAAKAGLKTGSATVDCVIAADGALSQCDVVKESNAGVGFGEMAKRIASGFATNPWTDEGVPAQGAHVRMPIQMVNEDAAAGASAKR